ncbi:hypothetical protein JCM15519_38720 [Fundidesulfovibrio butyratiphilus]
MKYTVKDRLEHNGKVYEAGSAVDLDEKAAAPLVAVGVLEPDPDAPKAPKKPGKTDDTKAGPEGGDPAPKQGA